PRPSESFFRLQCGLSFGSATVGPSSARRPHCLGWLMGFFGCCFCCCRCSLNRRSLAPMLRIIDLDVGHGSWSLVVESTADGAQTRANFLRRLPASIPPVPPLLSDGCPTSASQLRSVGGRYGASLRQYADQPEQGACAPDRPSVGLFMQAEDVHPWPRPAQPAAEDCSEPVGRLLMR